MNILGVGIDIVNIKRIEKILKRKNNKFKTKVFSKNEITYCKKKNTLAHFMQKDLRLRKLW